MLHLNARIDLDEIEVALGVHQELDGSGIGVADGLEGDLEGLGDVFAQIGSHGDRGRFLDQLLMAPLDGTFALAQHFHAAVGVGENLKFDMARVLDQLLHVHVAV